MNSKQKRTAKRLRWRLRRSGGKWYLPREVHFTEETFLHPAMQHLGVVVPQEERDREAAAARARLEAKFPSLVAKDMVEETV